MQFIDYILLGAVLLALGAAVYVIIRNNKKGKGCCSDCSRCAGCNNKAKNCCGENKESDHNKTE